MSSLSIKPPCIIFLDIDGVLVNPDYTPLDRCNQKFDEIFPMTFVADPKNLYATTVVTSHLFSPKAVENLKTLIACIEEVAQPQIVISSNWRLHHEDVESLKSSCFAHHGLDKYIIDMTTTKTFTQDKVSTLCNTYLHMARPLQCRASEIKHWLNNHPDIKHYVILDDIESHMNMKFGDHLILIDHDNLLTQSDITQALIATKLI